MGYLDNSSITVDAILTKRGRELLSRNDGSFKITQFALGDDEIDYSLFNESHPNGTQYSAEAIENMPLIEAIPNGAHSMNSKLITLARNSTAIPYITHGEGTGVSIAQGGDKLVSPSTSNLGAGASIEDYIFTVLDIRLFNDIEAEGGTGNTHTAADANEFSTIATSKTVRGGSVNLIATVDVDIVNSTNTSATTTLVIEGVDSGAIVQCPVTITYSGS